jgi:AraC-like DNA-binding protein
MQSYSDQLPPNVAVMAERHTGLSRRASAIWDGVIGDLIQKEPTGAHEISVTPSMDTLFLTRSQEPRRVIKRNGRLGDLDLTHPGWLLNLVAAEDTLATIAPDGMPRMDRLALIISPDVLQRVGIGSSHDRLRLRSSLNIQDPLERQLVAALAAEIEQPLQHSRLYAESLALALVVAIVRAHSEQDPHLSTQQGRGGLAPWQLSRLRDYFDHHLTENVSLAELAAFTGLSQSHFSRAFKASTGLPPHQYQLGTRIRRAKHLLSHTTFSLSEVAISCGFADQSHLGRAFRSRVGVRPSVWRQDRKS